jgi:hypothetical protein
MVSEQCIPCFPTARQYFDDPRMVELGIWPTQASLRHILATRNVNRHTSLEFVFLGERTNRIGINEEGECGVREKKKRTDDDLLVKSFADLHGSP